MQLLLGIDIGTSFIKAGVFTPLGEVVALNQAPAPLNRIGSVQGYYLADELWESVAELVGRLTKELSQSEWERLGVLGISSFGESGVLLGRDGGLRFPEVMAWYDERPKEIFEHLSQVLLALDPSRLRLRTGLLPDHTYSLAKLLWLRQECPKLLQGSLCWVSVADWIAFRLTGRLQMGLTQASRTLLFDLLSRRWMEDTLLEVGLNPGLLPSLRFPGAPIGPVTPEAASQSGLPSSLPVMEAGHDQACAAAGLGALDPGSIINACGTAETLLQIIGPDGLVDSLNSSTLIVGHHAIPDTYYLMATLRASGSVFDWFAHALFPGEDVEAARQSITQAASSIPPGADGLRFIPHLRQLTDNPEDVALPGGVFWGLQESHHSGHLARAVLEGLSFESYRLLERMRGAGKQGSSDPIRAVGGPTTNPVWMQIKADMLGRPIEIYECPHAAAWGAALLAWLHLQGQPLQGELKGLKPRARYMPGQTEAAAKLRRSYGLLLQALAQVQSSLLVPEGKA